MTLTMLVQLVELVLTTGVSVLSTLEVYSISSNLVRGDPDLSHGLQVRRWFMAAVGAANGARAIGVLLELLYTYICELLMVSPSLAVLTSFRLIPSLPYFTMYSLLTVYMAQLCYTVNGLPFFHVRNLWFFSNFSLYLVVIISLVFFVGSDYAYGSFFVTYLLDLGMLTWYSKTVFKVIPAQSSVSKTLGKKLVNGNVAPTANSTTTASSTSRIVSRLWPLIVVCSFGVCLSSLNFLFLVLRVIPSTLSPEPPTPTQDLFEIIVVMFSEVAPSIAFLFVLPKLSNNFEEPSLLSIVVQATMGHSNYQESYSLVEETTTNHNSYHATASR